MQLPELGEFIMISVGKHAVSSFTARIGPEGFLGLAHASSSQESIATSFFDYI